MERQNLIEHLVSRVLQAAGHGKPVYVFAHAARKPLCFAATGRKPLCFGAARRKS